MKKAIFLMTFSLMLTHVQAQKAIKGNGQMTRIQRTTSNYNTVNFVGSFDYVLVAGKEGHITIEGEENLLENIITEVRNETLIVTTKKNVNLRTSKNKTIKITVPFEDIQRATLTGSGDLWNESVISNKHFEVALVGSGDIKFHVASEFIDVIVKGSGDVIMKGKSNKLKVSVIGSGDFKGFDLKTTDVDVSVNGSGDAQISSTGHLKARVSGSGDIKYKGAPHTEDFNVKGSGSINKH